MYSNSGNCLTDGVEKDENGQLQKLLEIVQAADDRRQTQALAGTLERKQSEVYLETKQTRPNSLLSHLTKGYSGPTDLQTLF